MICKQCEKEFVLLNSQQKYCSEICRKISRNKQNVLKVTKRRKKLKQLALAYKGGKCQICSYNKLSDALEFHHVEPEHKDFGIAHKGVTHGWEKIKKELAKCILVCAVCHRECHAGLHDVSKIPILAIEEHIKQTKIQSQKIKKVRVIKVRQNKCPEKEVLAKLLWELPATELAKRFDVSDKAIEKWAKKYQLTKPSRGYWTIRKYSSVL